MPPQQATPRTVHHDSPPIRLFRSDWLEALTHVHPAVVAILYAPAILLFAVDGFRGLGPADGPIAVIALLVAGILVWTLVEYVLHRHVFHYEPKGRLLQRVWFMLHGVHHEQPQCKTRLVMPPALSIPLAGAWYGLFHGIVGVLLGAPLAVAPLFAGFLTGYLSYDLLHYAEHHLAPKGKALRYLKRYHLLHHFKTPDDRFGVSSPLWDLVFGTLPRDPKKG
jgi:sterol desaturase/sphingolipid hydroxylase (fatty acid hydroxylase superfamily)